MKEQLRFRSGADAAGFTILPNPVLLSRNLPDASLRLYALLRLFARSNGLAWPGMSRLAAMLGRSERQLRRDLAPLSALGLVTIERRGQGLTNRYWIEPLDNSVIDALNPAADPGGEPVLPASDRTLLADRTPESDPDRTPESA